IGRAAWAWAAGGRGSASTAASAAWVRGGGGRQSTTVGATACAASASASTCTPAVTTCGSSASSPVGRWPDEDPPDKVRPPQDGSAAGRPDEGSPVGGRPVEGSPAEVRPPEEWLVGGWPDGTAPGEGWPSTWWPLMALTRPAAYRAAAALDRNTAAPAPASSAACRSRPCGSPAAPVSETTTGTAA